jgi:hypothetical protein
MEETPENELSRFCLRVTLLGLWGFETSPDQFFRAETLHVNY